jgi:hypothetical protein
MRASLLLKVWTGMLSLFGPTNDSAPRQVQRFHGSLKGRVIAANGDTIEAEIDTGSSTSLIRRETYLTHFSQFPLRREARPVALLGIGAESSEEAIQLQEYITADFRLSPHGKDGQGVALSGELYILDLPLGAAPNLLFGMNILQASKAQIEFKFAPFGMPFLVVNDLETSLLHQS